MIQFQVKPVMDLQDVLVQWSIHLRSNGSPLGKGVPERNKIQFQGVLQPGKAEICAQEFDLCAAAVERLEHTLATTSDSKVIVADIDDLRRRLLDQAKSIFCITLTKHESQLYAPKGPHFGASVEAKFPQMSEDISEAGKCLGLGRSTAAVFHIMRVMELGVQTLGAELGVQLVTEKNWQNILDEVHKAIKPLNHKLQRTKDLSEAAAHLYSVKLAWRNEVMHPKQTYTPDEATAIFAACRSFVGQLAQIV